MGVVIHYEEDHGGRPAWRAWYTVSDCWFGRWVRRPESILRQVVGDKVDPVAYFFEPDPDSRVTVPPVSYYVSGFHVVPEGAKPATAADYDAYMRAVWLGTCAEVQARARQYGEGYWYQRGFEGLTADPAKVPRPSD